MLILRKVEIGTRRFSVEAGSVIGDHTYDSDGLIDYPEDPGCRDATSIREDPQCQDGINNDLGQDPNPGKIDYDAGYFANGSEDPAGPDPECLGRPWYNSEAPWVDPCGLGVELALLLPPLMWRWRRHRRRIWLRTSLST